MNSAAITHVGLVKMPDDTIYNNRSAPRARVLSYGGRKLIRTINGVSRTYDLVDRVAVFEKGDWREKEVSPDLREWAFVPHLGGEKPENRAPSRLCEGGTAQIVSGAPQS